MGFSFAFPFVTRALCVAGTLGQLRFGFPSRDVKPTRLPVRKGVPKSLHIPYVPNLLPIIFKHLKHECILVIPDERLRALHKPQPCAALCLRSDRMLSSVASTLSSSSSSSSSTDKSLSLGFGFFSCFCTASDDSLLFAAM